MLKNARTLSVLAPLWFPQTKHGHKCQVPGKLACMQLQKAPNMHRSGAGKYMDNNNKHVNIITSLFSNSSVLNPVYSMV